ALPVKLLGLEVRRHVAAPKGIQNDPAPAAVVALDEEASVPDGHGGFLGGDEVHVGLAELQDLGIEFDRLEERLRIGVREKPVEARPAETDHEHAFGTGLEKESGVERARIAYDQV